ncbi:carboxypeptidase regulatory-like domain-containing protein [Neolewinella sp.]|uniref:carboxypeptidase regulatory-like domain-containing protein n=1 Tax=Neolewinella sp. TaxID=2993543 RepID=UPI003B526569
MSTKDHQSENLLRRWISGAITAPEEAELERRAQSEPELREALVGLQTAPEADHQAHIARMMARVQPGLKAVPRRRPRYTTYAIAASVAMVLGLSVWLLPQYFGAENEAEIALERRAPVPAAPPSPLPTDAAPAAPPPEEVVAEADVAAAKPEVAIREEIEPAPAPQTTAARAEEVAEEEVSAETPAELADATTPAREVAPLAAPTPRAATETRSLPAPPPPLTGEVTDEEGNPIVGAEVLRLGQALGERTDSNGVFRLPQDRTLNEITVRAVGYEEETVDLFGVNEQLQIGLTPLVSRARADAFAENAARAEINMEPLIKQQSRALPVEGYRQLRERIEAGRPEGVPAGKVRVSFLVQPDGTLTDFRFRGQPDRATMDYVGTTLVESSAWEVSDQSGPVRVYFKLRFD